MDFFNVFTPVLSYTGSVPFLYCKINEKSEIYTNGKMDIVLYEEMLYNNHNLIFCEKSEWV